MQHLKLLHEILTKSHAIKHKTRQASVLSAVESLVDGANLSLSSLGRNLKKTIKPKSKIQEIDYLLSNGHLHKERCGIYRAVNEWMIGASEALLYIVIDWSTLVPHKQHLLRASLVRKGRCMTVYEEIHAESRQNTAEVHRTFLKNLKSVLPQKPDVCLIVDAGFRTDFFAQVEGEHWDYVGRILSNMHYKTDQQPVWKPCTTLYNQASSTPKTIGAVTLTRCNQLDSHLYLYKSLPEKQLEQVAPRKRKIKHGRKEKDHKNAANKPWLIASSIQTKAEKAIEIYRRRMKIEHDFRNTKDPRWGLGLRRSYSCDPERLKLQLLIGYLGAFVLWLIGLCLEKKGLHRDFQANSIKTKRILSLLFLALQAIKSGYMKYVSLKELRLLRKDGLYDEALIGQNL